MQLTHLLAFALSLATSEAAYKGFNYGATKSDGSVKSQSDFESEFSTAKNLVGTSGFTSARLYTMIQGGTTNSPISAIPAAIAENTSLLLGLWASGGGMDNELAALKSAISQYGDSFAKLVVGISVGSEDLYRASSEGEKVNAGIGIGPDDLVSFIKEVRSIISGTALSSVPIGHVDTWTAWTNGSNSAVIDAVDWLGFDGYPYFQSSMSNSISDAKSLFDDSVAKTKAVAKGKEVWITETGWPVSGSTQNLGVASLANAKTYWDEVGCPLFDETNTWCGSSATSTSAGSSSDSSSTNSGKSSSDSSSTNSGASASSSSILATGGASSVSGSVFGALVAVFAFVATL
ncbi:hypothetical protein AFCA_000122 [Aspergillus flavus]|nr:hypothetical protein AFCA_000122 [Aspergillus flavus]